MREITHCEETSFTLLPMKYGMSIFKILKYKTLFKRGKIAIYLKPKKVSKKNSEKFLKRLFIAEVNDPLLLYSFLNDFKYLPK